MKRFADHYASWMVDTNTVKSISMVCVHIVPLPYRLRDDDSLSKEA
jgi:hypothetical protein